MSEVPVRRREARRHEVDSVDDVLALVRAGGGRVTTARRLLLEAIFDDPGPSQRRGPCRGVQGRAPDIHLSTIYRNLEELERLGVVVHSHLGHGPATYHLAAGAHCHFVCEECGATIEVPLSLYAVLSKQADTRFGFAVNPGHSAVMGRCRACRRD